VSLSSIEDFYPLSPMQQGILFHTLYAQKSRVYFNQTLCTLHGNLNIPMFIQAWQGVVDRHPILRTAFVWEGLKEPVQVVHRQATLPWKQEDWRGQSPQDQQNRLEDFLRAEQEQGFTLDKAPLMRMDLVHLAKDTYQFIWNHHHLLLDGWSGPLLLKEVTTFYAAFCQDQNPHLELSRPYRDYIIWLQQQDLSQAEVFWRQLLKGFTLPTPLGIDRTSNILGSQGESYEEQEIRLSASVTAALKSLGRQHQLTLNTLVQGAWALLLSHYGNQDDVVFGVTVSGRPPTLIGSESIVGLLINTLPVRVQVPPEAFLLPWLQKLQAQQAELRQYEYSPLRQIQDWSEVARGMPLFQSIVVFENYPAELSLQEGSGELKIRNVRSIETTNYPLTLVAGTHPEVWLKLSYDNNRFDIGVITRMLGHLQTLLEGMAAHPKQQLSNLPLLSLAEQHQLLVWNDTQADYPQDQGLHQLFEAQVERTPDAIAVVFGDQQLSYQELNIQANQLGRYLQKLGVGPEVCVGICTERSLEMIVGLLGILKAGGAYVPLDPSYPQDRRLLFMLEETQIPVLLTQQPLVERLPKTEAKMVCLDSDWEAIAREKQENLASEMTGDRLAYVIYTSGSTGKPKGVAVPHQAINRLVFNSNYLRFDPSDRVAQASNSSFDAATFEIWGSLLHGARLVGTDKEVILWPQQLAAHIREQQLSVLFLTTALFNQLASQVPNIFNSLRYLLFGGEAVDSRRVKEILESSPPQQLLHVYGPTESTTFSSWHLVQEIPQEATSLSIGRPISNTQIYILNRNLQLVPIGVTGELHIGGAGLARGYFNRPELTAGQFIPNPFSKELGARLYKSGDLARYLPNGELEYLGRIDQQVKVRGFRVEPGEIEAVLVQYPGVRETVVLFRETQAGDKRLIAYIVPSNEQRLVTAELRDFLKQQLPEYMMPVAFVLLEKLPLTPNGKVDRHSLPAPDTARSELDEAFTDPRTQKEKVLAEIWAQVLSLEQVSIHDNFFALGGDSILSLQIIARANQAGLQFTPKQLFQYQTIAELAVVASVTQVMLTEQSPITGPVPLTPIQCWFFEQSLPEPHHWNQAVLLEVRQALDPTLLQQVVKYLLEHHDALRLRFERESDRWLQTSTNADDAAPFSWVDLSAFPLDQQKSALENSAAQLQASLDLAQGPLLRVAVFDLATHQPSRLLLIIHHLAIDGVSWRILLEDLQTAYQQISLGEAIQLPPKTTSFKQWAELLQEYAHSAQLQQEWDYWLAKPRQQVLRLPVDFPEAINTVATACTVSVSLNQEQTQALIQEVPTAYRTQINDVLLTALMQTFEQWTQVPFLLVDLEGHGREDFLQGVNLSRTVGWFTTISPIYLNLEAVSSPGDALKTIKEQLRKIPNQGLGYGVLRYLSSKTQETAEQLQAIPQPEVSFNYLGQFDQVLPNSSLFRYALDPSGPTCYLQGSRTHLLDITGFIVGGELQMNWVYSEKIHRRITVEALAQGFIKNLQALIAHCQSHGAGGYTPSDFSLVQLSQDALDEALGRIEFEEDTTT